MALAPELVSACNLAGRQLWLQILGADGSITTYSLGSPPSAIWRGPVLMRCGQAYGPMVKSKLQHTSKPCGAGWPGSIFKGMGWLLIAQGRAPS